MVVRTPKELGALIRSRRRQLGLDQATLAERVGVSRKWLIEIEGGKSRADLGLILRTLDVLDLSLDVAARETKLQRAPSAEKAVTDIDAVVARARRHRSS